MKADDSFVPFSLKNVIRVSGGVVLDILSRSKLTYSDKSETSSIQYSICGGDFYGALSQIKGNLTMSKGTIINFKDILNEYPTATAIILYGNGSYFTIIEVE